MSAILLSDSVDVPILFFFFLNKDRITALVFIMSQITNTFRLQDFEAEEGPGHRRRHQVSEVPSPSLKSCLYVQLCALWWGIHPTISVLAMSGLPKSAAP